MAFKMIDFELQEMARTVFKTDEFVEGETSKCFYIRGTSPSFGEVPLQYIEYMNNGISRDRLVYIPVN